MNLKYCLDQFWKIQVSMSTKIVIKLVWAHTLEIKWTADAQTKIVYMQIDY